MPRLLRAVTVAVVAVLTFSPAAAVAQDATPDAAALMAKATEVQQKFFEASLAYDTAKAEADRLTGLAEAATAKAEEATAKAQRGRDALASVAADAYMTGSSPQTDDLMDVVDLTTSTDPDSRLRAQDDLSYVHGARGLDVQALIEEQNRARAAREAALATAATARAAQTAAQDALTAAQDKAVNLSLEIEEALTAAGDSGGAAGAEQEALNRVAEKAWKDYRATLARSKVTAPKVAALAKPSSLPKGLTARLGPDGKPVPGAAMAGKVPVVGSEAMTSVTAALAALRKPYVPNTSGPDAYDCGGLTSTVWGRAGFRFSSTPATQWATGVPVDAAVAQPGDLVFLTAPGAGVQHVGIVVAPGMMVAASSATFVVGAARIPAKPFGVVRPGLKATKLNPVPARAKDASITCGSANALPMIQSSIPQGAATTGGRSWGGYSNGMIPRTVLCPIGPEDHLRCDAAAAFLAMNAAYKARFKTGICINDGYRSYAKQVNLFATSPKGFAAFPGTSTHGWALAMDLGCGINQFSSPQYQWMKANAPKFNIHHPAWAEPGGRAPEPWHWEFGRVA